MEKGDKKITGWDKFKNSVFEIKCTDLLENSYSFKYRILDCEKKDVQSLGFKMFLN